jgi:hypothetical protein
MCETCGEPTRLLWTYENYPRLQDVKVGNWVSLQCCPQCGRLWCSIAHEPYAGFTFLTAWPYDVQSWLDVHGDDGTKLHEWHDAVIREEWKTLSEVEREAIERWRDRTYRHYNPIDQGPDVPTPKHIRMASDLAKIIESTK